MNIIYDEACTGPVTTLTLTQLRTLRARVANELNQLRTRREETVVVDVAGDEDVDAYVAVPVEVLNMQIDALRARLNALNEAVGIANATVINHAGSQVTIGGLVSRNVDARQELKFFNSAARKPLRARSGYSADLVSITTFPPAEAQQIARRLTAECDARSALIDLLDQTTTVTLPSALVEDER